MILVGRFGSRLAAAAAVLAFASTSQANLLTNGSFEMGVNPPVSPPFAVISTGDNATLTGWTVGGAAGVDWLQSGYWQASQGDYSLDLNALDAGSVSQTFATTAGNTYSVTYDLSLNPDTNLGFPPNRSALVTATNTDDNSVIGSLAHSFAFNSVGSTLANMNWTPYGFSFTATGSQTTLTFASTNSEAGGVALDNVSVLDTNEPNPIPAPAGLLLGLLGVGIAARFRRRNVAVAAE